MTNPRKPALAAALVLSLGLALSGCGSSEHNRSLNSVNQPVVEHRNYAIDLAVAGNGLSPGEQRRLSDWFDSMGVRYGDRIALDGAAIGPGVEDDVANIAGRHGLLLTNGAPVTEGYIQPGSVRVVITRARAFVPNCPDFSDHYSSSLDNATSDNYGCAINSNIAAMVADPEHLLHGASGTGETVVMSSSKAIATYRAQEPTGKAGLPTISTQSAGGK